MTFRLWIEFSRIYAFMIKDKMTRSKAFLSFCGLIWVLLWLLYSLKRWMKQLLQYKTHHKNKSNFETDILSGHQVVIMKNQSKLLRSFEISWQDNNTYYYSLEKISRWDNLPFSVVFHLLVKKIATPRITLCILNIIHFSKVSPQYASDNTASIYSAFISDSL